MEKFSFNGGFPVSMGDSLRDIPHLIPESFLAQTFKGGYNWGILNYSLLGIFRLFLEDVGAFPWGTNVQVFY